MDHLQGASTPVAVWFYFLEGDLDAVVAWDLTDLLKRGNDDIRTCIFDV